MRHRLLGMIASVISMPASFWRALKNSFRRPNGQESFASSLRALDCMQFEDRTLFSVTPVGDLLVQAGGDAIDDGAVAGMDEGASSQVTTADSLDQSASDSRHIRRELVLVDGAVTDYDKLIADLRINSDGSRQFDVAILDSDRDAIGQISELLAQYDELSAIHFVSHASDGELKLGDLWLTNSNIGDYAEQIAQWRESLTDDGDLLFYGCELAAGEQGQTMLAKLGQLTGADVAASIDNTGHALFGGNWNLEFTTGSIESAVAFSATAQQDWVNLLNVAVDSASSAAGANQSTVTISHTTAGTNRLMLVGIAVDPHGETLTSVTYNGVGLTFVGAREQPGQHSRVEIWSLVAPDTGTHDVVISLTGNGYHGFVAGVMTFTGVDQTTPIANFASDFGNSTTASVTVSSQTNNTVFALVHSHAGTSAVPGGSQTEYWDLNDEGGTNSSGTIAAGAASVVNTWTVDNDDWTAAGVSIQSTNVAPVLDNAATPVLNSVNEDAGAPSGAVGTLISSLVDFALPAGQVDNVTDSDSGSLLGIAVTAADTTNGTWWYSTNDGANWNALGSVADNNARLLAADANTRIYFQPGANYNGTISSAVTFRAWDQSTGTNGSSADTSTNGGGTAFSTATDTAAITVNAVNDAPVLDNTGTMTLTTITEDDVNNAGNTVASIIASAGGDRITDVDGGAAEGIAITSLTSGNGAWEYSIDGGGNWLSVGTVAGNSALLLRDTDLVRFVPDGANGGSNSITFRAWDQTSGSAGTKVDATTNGGTTAFSTAVETAAISVTSVNDAPVLDNTGTMTLTSITEDDVNNSGNAIFSIVASAGGDRITDVDSAAFEGVAITGLVSGNGTWQYSTSGGASWNNVGAVANNSALLLRETDRVRFVPDGVNADAASITFRAWDETSGTAGTKVDVSVNGGSTAFSAATESANITVTAVNDAPTIAVPGIQSTNEDTALVFSSGNGNQISVADIDAGTGSVQVRLVADRGLISLAGVAGLTFTAGDGASDATMTFTGTVTNINTALNGLSFTPAADYSGPAELQIIVDDQANTGAGGSLNDSDAVAITVTAVNDAPTLNLPASQSTAFQQSVVFSGAQGNLIDIVDVDAGSASLQLTIAAQNGTFTLSQTTGLAFLTGTGSADQTAIIQGSLSDINAALNGFVFTPVSTFRGTATIDFAVDDLGNTGAGGALQDSGQVVIDVLPAAQRLLFNGPLTQPADNFRVTFSNTNGNGLIFADVYDENPVLTVSITAAHGVLALSGTGGLTFLAGGAVGSAMTFTGTLSDVNAALEGAQFAADASDSSLSIQASDPPRDGVGPHSIDALVAVTQPAIFPSVDPSPVEEADADPIEAVDTGMLPPATSQASEQLADVFTAKAPPMVAAHYAGPTGDVVRNVASVQLVVRSTAPADTVSTEFAAHDFQFKDVKKIALRSATNAARLVGLDALIPLAEINATSEPTSSESFNDLFIAGTAGITVTLSVGYLLWTLKAGSLLSAFLSSMPAWQAFDPLPVLDVTRRREADDDEEGDDVEDDPLFVAVN